MVQRKILLVVEDDHDLRRFFQLILSNSGFDVHSARDGYEALSILEGVVPDVIVLDLRLPRIKGSDVLAELESNARTRNIPVLVVTGTTDKPANQNIRRLLRKPVTPEALVEAIEQCLAEDRV